MSKNDQKKLFVAGGIIFIGILMLSDPQCDRGCRTVAEHLLDHGIEEFMTKLLV